MTVDKDTDSHASELTTDRHLAASKRRLNQPIKRECEEALLNPAYYWAVPCSERLRMRCAICTTVTSNKENPITAVPRNNPQIIPTAIA